jgi:hypothetical protein
MKIKLHHTVPFPAIFALLVLLLPAVTYAQDSEHQIQRNYSITPPPDTEEQNNESFNLVEDERIPGRVSPNAYMLRDSMMSKSQSHTAYPAHRKATSDQRNQHDQKNLDKQKEEKQANESILSFNFIYYIFQKFKLSDIVDDK